MSREGVGLSETVGVVSGSLFFSSFSQLDLQLAGLAATMCMKSLQKYLMEKGETLILLGLFESQTWAMYGIVQNLGSLAVRLVFLPLEEMAQLAFSKLLSSKDFDEALEVFSVLSQLVVFIGLLVASFGQGYSFALVHILYGVKWSSTDMPGILGWYSLYVMLLALNGVTEAFTHASATPAQIRARGLRLVPVTGGYLLLASLLAPTLGVKALIIGNCVNMTMRIALSIAHAHSFFESSSGKIKFSGRMLLPGFSSSLTFVCCGAIALLSESLLLGRGAIRPHLLLVHILVGVVLLILCGLVVRAREGAFLSKVRGMIRKGKNE